jgi:hypothetical protein
METRKMMMDMEIKSTPTFKLYKGRQVRRSKGRAARRSVFFVGGGGACSLQPGPTVRTPAPPAAHPHKPSLEQPCCRPPQCVETTTGINDLKLKTAMRRHMLPREPGFEPDEAERKLLQEGEAAALEPAA